MFKGLQPILYGGREVWPLVEGGKGVSATNHMSSGAWAAAGGIGTVSAVNADSYDPDGRIVPQIYRALTRRERHDELVQYAIDGAVAQVRKAHDIAGGKGAININVLWEMGGAQRVLEGVLERTRGLVSGVTCGAGMPYKLSEIAAAHNVSYLPIISSARAFRALWKRAYSKAAEWLSAVVYEDPWLAGGHNGLSNAEDPRKPQDPLPRVAELRATMREGGIADSVPIVMAGGVWRLDEWENWIDNPELGSIVFQFGTRPLLTQESPIPPEWKSRLTMLEEGDILLHRFSPTGFYSSAVRNPFLRWLEARSERQIAFTKEPIGDHAFELDVGIGRKKNYWVTRGDLQHAREWYGAGFTQALKTPDDTLVFATPDDERIIRKDQADCMGCLSQCAFSSWADNEKNTTGRLADPRSFCIQKTLQDIAHGGPVDQNLMFAGHAAFRFRTDPFYSNGFVPTVKQLVDRILTGGVMFTIVIPANAGTQRKQKNWVPAFAGMTMMLAVPAHAEDKKPPYWASIASGQAMMRTGPGKNYPGIWLYQRRDLPVRVVQVHETWRRIEDPDGQQGWMLVTMLSDQRTVLMKAGAPKPIRDKAAASARVTYRAAPGVVGRVDHCNDGWCHIAIAKRQGFVAMADVWGLGAGEVVE